MRANELVGMETGNLQAPPLPPLARLLRPGQARPSGAHHLPHHTPPVPLHGVPALLSPAAPLPTAGLAALHQLIRAARRPRLTSGARAHLPIRAVSRSHRGLLALPHLTPRLLHHLPARAGASLRHHLLARAGLPKRVWHDHPLYLRSSM